MRDFDQIFLFPPQALVPVEAPVRALPAGLLAAAILAGMEEDTSKGDTGTETDDACDAWLDGALEDSFPASDPIASNRYD